MRVSDCFALGQVATGDRFIGRKKECEALSIIFTSGASVHLIGATRIGKTSLVARVFQEHAKDEGVLPIWLSMSSCADAFSFWYEFGMSIVDAVEEAGLELKSVPRLKSEFNAIDAESRNWHMRIQVPLKKMLKELRSFSYRVVMAIDEFDAVYTVFGEGHEHYQLLRSLFSGDFAINGVIISRRTLAVLEEKARVIAASNFSNVFDTLRLVRFSEGDMALFYEKLGSCGIALSPEAKERFDYYTGGIPYLCCLLAYKLSDLIDENEVSQVPSSVVDEARRACTFVAQNYYDDLVRKLEEDDHLEPLVYLAFGEMKTLAYEHNRNNMIQMGYLNEDKVDDKTECYAYCRDFMQYLRRRKLNMPIRDLLDAGEKRLKRLFAKEYPQFEQVRYSDIVIGDNPDQSAEEAKTRKIHSLTRIPGLRYSWESKTELFLKDAAVYMENPSVLDTMTINYVMPQIYNWHWGDRFAKYFPNDPNGEPWNVKLERLDGIRNPFAHAHGEYVPQEKVEECNHILEELINLPFEEE